MTFKNVDIIKMIKTTLLNRGRSQFKTADGDGARRKLSLPNDSPAFNFTMGYAVLAKLRKIREYMQKLNKEQDNSKSLSIKVLNAPHLPKNARFFSPPHADTKQKIRRGRPSSSERTSPGPVVCKIQLSPRDAKRGPNAGPIFDSGDPSQPPAVMDTGLLIDLRSPASKHQHPTSKSSAPEKTKEKSKGKLKADILKDLNWCIEEMEKMGAQHTHETPDDLGTDRLRQRPSFEIVEFNSEKTSDNGLLEYLSEFMGGIENSYMQHEPASSNVSTDVAPHRDREGETEEQRSLRMSMASKYAAQCMLNLGIRGGSPEEITEVLKTRKSWALDIFKLSQVTEARPLATLALAIFHDWNFPKKFQIPMDKLMANLTHAESLYRRHLPYHNSMHAADVMASVNYVLTVHALDNIFTELETFATLYAAAMHDINHPGYNNQYMVKTKCKLACLYNDRSVLENHHISVIFRILADPQYDIISNMKARDARIFRKIVTDVIMSTDPVQHMNVFTDLKLMLDNQPNSNTDNSHLFLENFRDKVTLLDTIVHCCDISNPLKPLEQYQKWVKRIMCEFFRQGDQEKAQGMEISPMCDRYKTDISKSQIGFIDFVVAPIWETLCDVIAPHGEPLIKLLADNKRHYTTHKVPQQEAIDLTVETFSKIGDVDKNRHVDSLFDLSHVASGVLLHEAPSHTTHA